MPPEDIPEDREESYPCDCGGRVAVNVFGVWTCDKCDFTAGGEEDAQTSFEF